MFGLDNIIKSVVSQAIDIAAPMVLNAICPGLGAVLGPVVAEVAKEAIGSALNDKLGEMGRDGTMPKFLAAAAQDILKQVLQSISNPCDKSHCDFVKDKCGSAINDMVEKMLKDFTSAITQYLDDASKKGQGKGGCGKGGQAGGTGGTQGGGTVGLRELAQILADLEQKQALNVKLAAQKAGDALGVAKSTGKDDAAAKQNAQIEADQFRAMEENKAEAQIFQALSSAISEVMKNFGGALNTASRGG